MERVGQLLEKFDQLIITPAIMIIFTAGFFLFVWGLVQFLWNLDQGSHEDGKRHMVWGIVGMFVMVSVWGIIQIIIGTFDLDPLNPDINRLQLPGDFFGGGS